MHIVDTHSHLDMPQFGQDLPQVVRRAALAGVQRIISVGTDLESSRRCVELARRFSGRIYAAAGVHPNHLCRAGPDAMRELEVLCRLDEVVAVGETGLDFHHRFASRDLQISAFKQHIHLALSVGKPLIIHARRADEEVLRIVSEQRAAIGGVRHCFDGAAPVAARYLELGLYVSVAGTVTRSGFKKLKRAVRTLPADRLLVETDCPYQTPVSRTGMRNEPAFIVDTLGAIAAIRGETPEAVAAATTTNALELFCAMEGDGPGDSGH